MCEPTSCKKFNLKSKIIHKFHNKSDNKGESIKTKHTTNFKIKVRLRTKLSGSRFWSVRCDSKSGVKTGLRLYEGEEGEEGEGLRERAERRESKDERREKFANFLF